MFWRRNKQPKTVTQERVKSEPIQEHTRVDFTQEVSEEEVEVVSVIASAILAENHADTTFKLVSVKGVDQDKEAAAMIAASVLAHDLPESVFRLVSIRESERRQ